MQRGKTIKNNREKTDQRITVLFTRMEMEAIAKKAIASHLKKSQVIRLYTLKGLGAIQLNLFS